MAAAVAQPTARAGHRLLNYQYSENVEEIGAGKYTIHASDRLCPLDKHDFKGIGNDSDFIQTEFYPRFPKAMATSLRGSSAQQYIAERVSAKEDPMWNKELDHFEQEAFDELYAILEGKDKVDAGEVFEVLERLDIDLMQEEVSKALVKARDFITRRVDFCDLLFELCDSEEYLQRIKKNRALYKHQKIGQYTKRQILFYSIMSKATFPEFPKDPILYRANAHFRPHVLKYYLPSAKTTGLTTRQLLRKAKELDILVSRWREAIKSTYNEPVVFPPEPNLLRQQRLWKERMKRGISQQTSSRTKPLSTKVKEPEEKNELLLSDKISILASRAYKAMEKPVQKYPPEDYIRHAADQFIIPTPLLRLHKDFLAAMKRYYVTTFDLPNIWSKIHTVKEDYYDVLIDVLVERSLRHWIATYSEIYRDRALDQQFAMYFRRYSQIRRSEAFVRNPWLKPTYWVGTVRMHSNTAFK